VQEQELHDDQEQEENAGSSGIQEVLQQMPQALESQRNQVTTRGTSEKIRGEYLPVF
jgi:hypothetical protein